MSTYIVVKQTATVRELILLVAQTLRVRVRDLNVSIQNQALDFESRATLKDYNIFNKTTVQCGLPPGGIFYENAARSSLYSHCEECGMEDECPFKHTWDICELSKTHGNAYLILCQAFSLPSDVIKIIEDNNESNGIRLGDAIHRICHKNPNLTREEVIKIISNGKA